MKVHRYPYLGDPDCRIYPDDCLVFMKRQRPGSVDLAFADPPFNIGQTYGGQKDADRLPRDQFVTFTREWLRLLVWLVRPGGSLFLHLPDSMADWVGATATRYGMRRVNWIILHQEFGQYREGNFIESKNHLLYYVKPGGDRTWNVEQVLEPSRRLTAEDARTETAKYKGYRPFLDVWSGPNLGRVQGNNEERWNPELHPNQLPELYLARVLRCASNPGDLVLDPFTGSGTTPCVAKALGRRFIGSEAVPESAASAWERVKRGPVRNVAGPLWTASMPGGKQNGQKVISRKEYGL